MSRTSTAMGVLIVLAVSNSCRAFDPEANGAPPEVVKKENLDCVVTYSVIETGPDRKAVLARIKAAVVPKMTEAGATLYAVWIPIPDAERFLQTAPKYKRAKFVGLKESQLCLMLVWPSDGIEAKNLDAAIRAVEGVKTVDTRTYDPIYLATTEKGIGVPAGRGFYVQRESQYPLEDVAAVVRLSKEAWQIFDPYWNTKVIGLFRRRTQSKTTEHQLRIVHYPDVKTWHKSHDRENNAPEVVKLRKIFRERAQMRVEGSRSDAYVTDRAVP